MKSLLRTRYLTLIISGIIIALALLIFNYTWSFGFILGFIFSFITLRITESQIDSVLFNQKKGIMMYVKFILGNLIYLIPFTISLIFSQMINIIFVALGLLYFKYFMFVAEIFFRKKEN